MQKCQPDRRNAPREKIAKWTDNHLQSALRSMAAFSSESILRRKNARARAYRMDVRREARKRGLL